MALREPKTFQDAIRYFSDFENCKDYVVARRWPNGVSCPTCDSKDVKWLPNQRRWYCVNKHPKRQFSLKTGTICEESPISMEKWLPAMWQLANCKNGISSYELAANLGVTQRSAWFMLHRIRYAMQEGAFEKMRGEVEADETFIGGLSKFMHGERRKRAIKGTGGAGKVAVMGVLQRTTEGKKSRVQATVVPNVKRRSLHEQIRQAVEPGSTVYSDALKSYEGLGADYKHQVIDHAETYVKGRVHTNGIENFWSMVKRCLKGTYISVEPFHLHRYLDEEVFRFNARHETPAARLSSTVAGMTGRRLTYKQLTTNAGS